MSVLNKSIVKGKNKIVLSLFVEFQKHSNEKDPEVIRKALIDGRCVIKFCYSCF